ncbi:MAG TPA: VOC family protein [Solirubrobacterales bacterium]|jgi:catechol 2,3-dioxygenase-like lactoylglutathione lyase family enzyme|nr:VOC family protein [Solirubrobacterales bacterium]
MLDHVGIEVSDYYPRSKAFYEAALGVELLMEFAESSAGFGSETEIGPKPYFWVHARGRPVTSGAHLAFAATDRATVDAFHAAALAAGATDTALPGRGRSTTRAITAPSFSTPTATTSRPSAAPPERRGSPRPPRPI